MKLENIFLFLCLKIWHKYQLMHVLLKQSGKPMTTSGIFSIYIFIIWNIKKRKLLNNFWETIFSKFFIFVFIIINFFLIIVIYFDIANYPFLFFLRKFWKHWGVISWQLLESCFKRKHYFSFMEVVTLSKISINYIKNDFYYYYKELINFEFRGIWGFLNK